MGIVRQKRSISRKPLQHDSYANKNDSEEDPFVNVSVIK